MLFRSPVNTLIDIIEEVDLILIMSVNPGFGGQQFIEHTYKKVSDAKALINASNSTAMIEVDGGVTSANASQLVQAGADVLVAGSFVFRAENPSETIADLKNCSIVSKH